MQMHKLYLWACLFMSFTASIFAEHTVRTMVGEFNPETQEIINYDGKVTPSGDISVDTNDNLTLNFKADPGYVIGNITITQMPPTTPIDVPITNFSEMEYTITNIVSDYDVHVTYVDNRTRIMARTGEYQEDQNYNWTIVKHQGSISPGPELYVPVGSSKTFTITPDQNYIIDQVFIYDGISEVPIPIDNHEGMQYTIENITPDMEIRATFTDSRTRLMARTGEYQEDQNYNWTIVKHQGSISPGPELYVPIGSSKTFTITPDTNYIIDQIFVYDGYTEVQVPITNHDGMQYTIENITPDMEIRATFTDSRTRLMARTGEYGEDQNYNWQIIKHQGSISPGPELYVPVGSSKTFTITPDTNYIIDQIFVYDGYTEIQVPITNHDGMQYTIENISPDMEIRATFTRIGEPPFNPITFSIHAEVNSMSPTEFPENSGFISLEPLTTNIELGSSKTFSVTPALLYKIQSVTIFNEGNQTQTDLIIEDPMQLTHTIEDIHSNLRIVATFEQNTFDIYTDLGPADEYGNPSDKGSISLEPLTTGIEAGSSKTFSITPIIGYKIHSVSIMELDNNYEVTELTIQNPLYLEYTLQNIQGDIAIHVEFQENTFDIYTELGPTDEYGNPSDKGSISLEPLTTGIEAGSSKTFSITPIIGYKIHSVSLMELDNNYEVTELTIQNPLYLEHTLQNIQGDIAIQVEFEENSFFIDTEIGPPDKYGYPSNNGFISLESHNEGIEAGSSKTFSVTPGLSYKIQSVAIFDQETQTQIELDISNPQQFTYTIENIQSNLMIIANFEDGQQTIYTQVGDADEFGNPVKGAGTIEPEPFVKVDYGQSKSFNIKADPGHIIESVLIVDLETQEQTELPIYDSKEFRYTFESITKDMGIAAFFIPENIIDFDLEFRDQSGISLYEDLKNAVEFAQDGYTIQFKSDLTIPFTEELSITKAINLVASEDAKVIFDGQHQTRILFIDVENSLPPTEENSGLLNMKIEGIEFTRGNNVASWAKYEEDGITQTPVTFNPETATWGGATINEVIGLSSKSEFPEGVGLSVTNVNLTLNRVNINNCYASSYGSALFIANGSLNISNSKFTSNLVTNHESSNYSPYIGGGIIGNANFYSPLSDFVIQNNLFQNNIINRQGTQPFNGGILFSATKVDNDLVQPVKVHKNKVLYNTVNSMQGGPIKGFFFCRTNFNTTQEKLVFSSNIISGNNLENTFSVGAAFNHFSRTPGGEVDIYNNLISNNNFGHGLGNTIAILSQSSYEPLKVNFYHNSIINNSSDSPFISIRYNTDTTFTGNLITENNSEFYLQAQLVYGEGNYITEGGYSPLPNDIPEMPYADLKLTSVLGQDGLSYLIPAFDSPLIDHAPMPTNLPPTINLHKDVLGNLFAGVSRDIGAIDNTPTHSISITEAQNGTITPDSEFSVLTGSNYELTFTPDENYELSSVLINENSIPVTAEGMIHTLEDIQEIQTISATFSPTQHSVITNAGANGTITFEGDSSIEHGASKTFTIIPVQSYIISSLSVKNLNTNEVTPIINFDPTSTIYTVESVTSPIEVSATFEDGRHNVITTQGDAQGNLNNGLVIPHQASLTEYGDSFYFDVVPNEFYRIDAITIINKDTNETTQITDITPEGMTNLAIDNVVNNFEINATFIDGRHFVNVSTGLLGEFGQGNVNFNSNHIEYNGTFTFDIIPHQHYLIDAITVSNQSGSSNIPITDVTGMAGVTIENITETQNLNVLFRDGRSSISTSLGNWQGSYANGSITSQQDPTVDYLDSYTFQVTPDTYHHIKALSVRNVSTNVTTQIPITDVNGMPYTLTGITSDQEINAQFEDMRHMVYAAPTENGTITVPTDPRVAYNGSSTLTITPDQNYMIETIQVKNTATGAFTDKVITDRNGMQLIVSNVVEHMEVQASFTPLPQIYAIANDYTDPVTNEIVPAPGTISDEGYSYVAYEGSKTYTIASPEDWKIAEVLVDGTPVNILDLNQMEYTFDEVTADQTIEVSFAPLHLVTATAGVNGSTDFVEQRVDTGSDLSIEFIANAGYVIDKITVNGDITALPTEEIDYTLDLTDINEDKDISVTFRKEAVIEQGVIEANSDSWTTVNTNRNYTSMVLATTPITNKSTVPAVVRIQNVTANSFDIKLTIVDKFTTVAFVSLPVTYFIAEEGTYTEEADGIKFEARKVLSNKTARKGSWPLEARTYQNSYNTPVVIGQVMTTNDAEWSVFWTCGNKRQNPPSKDYLHVGKHVGEDPYKTRADETVGFMVFETGSAIFNQTVITAQVGIDKVDGVNNNGYTYSGLPDADLVVAAQNAEDGGDGGFAVMIDNYIPNNGNLIFAIDEDKLKDTERSHTTEQVAWIATKVLTETTALSDTYTHSGSAVSGNLISNDFINQSVRIEIAPVELNGSLTWYPNGEFDYTPSVGSEADSFEYSLLDAEGNIISTGQVNINQ